jgi:methylthioribose-1-phosphate isomerase
LNRNEHNQSRPNFYEQRTVEFDESQDAVRLIDQSILPDKLSFVDCTSVDELIRAITSMQIRGAPAIGVAGAMGVALAFKANMKIRSTQSFLEALREDAKRIKKARPTAVNLTWGVDQALDLAEKGLAHGDSRESVYRDLAKFVNDLADKDVKVNKALSDIGSALIPDNASVLTHCN